MPNRSNLFATYALGTALCLLPSAVANAQDTISEITPAQITQALSQPSANASEMELWQAPFMAESGSLPQSSLTVAGNGSMAHIMPLATDKVSLNHIDSDFGPLIYHGGPIMQSSVTIYPIFWVPAKLQNGHTTGMSAHYRAVETTMLGAFMSHGLGAIHTQYYQKSGTTTTFIQNKGGLGTAYLDTAAYPGSGCSDPATPGACLSDAQIQAEVKKVMAAAHLTGGLNKIFMVFTSSGEGSCLNSSSCSYRQFCAYHSYFKVGTTPVVYANQPYGTTSGCQTSGAPSPNNDAVADAAATAASHELSEAITDPELNAWFTSQGNENGDLCAYKYGPLTWDAGKANQMWNGSFFLLQTEFDNHANGCYQVGP